MCPYRMVFRAVGEIGLAFEPMVEPGDFQNLLAVFVEVDEFQPAEEFLAALLHPKQRFKPVAVDEPAFLKIDDEIDDLPLIDVLFERFLGFGGGVGEKVALDLNDADLAVFFALDAHGSSLSGDHAHRRVCC